jgi:hypothetical protein
VKNAKSFTRCKADRSLKRFDLDGRTTSLEKGYRSYKWLKMSDSSSSNRPTSGQIAAEIRTALERSARSLFSDVAGPNPTKRQAALTILTEMIVRRIDLLETGEGDPTGG